MVMLVLSILTILTIDYHQQTHKGHLQRLLHQWPQPPPLRRVATRRRGGDVGNVADGEAALCFLLDALILRGRWNRRKTKCFSWFILVYPGLSKFIQVYPRTLAVEARNFQVWEKKIDALLAFLGVWACSRVDERVWIWKERLVKMEASQIIQVTRPFLVLTHIKQHGFGDPQLQEPVIFSKRQLWETVVLMMELGSPDLCQNLKQSEDLHEKRGYVYIIVYVYVWEWYETKNHQDLTRKGRCSIKPWLDFSPFSIEITGICRTTCCAKEPTAAPFPAGHIWWENRSRKTRESGTWHEFTIQIVGVSSQSILFRPLRELWNDETPKRAVQ